MTDQINPLLQSIKIPGSTFRLPSQALFYSPSEISDTVKNGEVEVYPMTAFDEIILNTPDKLLSGKAITEIFQRCIPQILDANALLAKDVDFLMVCLRSVSFGNTMDVSYTHDCPSAVEHSHSVDINGMIRQTKTIDPTSINGEYTLVMTSGQTVHLKPLTYGDIVELYQNTALLKSSKLTVEDAEKLVVNTLVGVIRDVDGITDKKLIKEWVMSIPLGWKKQLETAAQSVSEWGINLVHSGTCPDCGESIEIPISANPVSFFM